MDDLFSEDRLARNAQLRAESLALLLRKKAQQPSSGSTGQASQRLARAVWLREGFVHQLSGSGRHRQLDLRAGIQPAGAIPRQAACSSRQGTPNPSCWPILVSSLQRLEPAAAQHSSRAGLLCAAGTRLPSRQIHLAPQQGSTASQGETLYLPAPRQHSSLTVCGSMSQAGLCLHSQHLQSQSQGQLCRFCWRTWGVSSSSRLRRRQISMMPRPTASCLSLSQSWECSARTT